MFALNECQIWGLTELAIVPQVVRVKLWYCICEIERDIFLSVSPNIPNPIINCCCHYNSYPSCIFVLNPTLIGISVLHQYAASVIDRPSLSWFNLWLARLSCLVSISPWTTIPSFCFDCCLTYILLCVAANIVFPEYFRNFHFLLPSFCLGVQPWEFLK